MATDYERARQELDAILADLMTDKHLRQSDKMLLAKAPGSEWHKKTAERNRKNAGNKKIIEKITNSLKGRRCSFHDDESKTKLAKAGWQPVMTEQGPFESRKAARQYYFDNKLTPCNTLGSTEQWIHRALKNRPTEYYYISREEYIRLTGTNPYE